MHPHEWNHTDEESDRLHTVPFIKYVHRNTYRTAQTYYLVMHKFFEGFPDSSVGKESACNAGDLGLIPGFGRSTGEGIGSPLQYSWASLVAQLVKNPSTCNTGDLGLTPGLRRTPGKGKGYPLQYSGLENSMDKSMGSQKVRHNWVTFTFFCVI